MVDCTVWRVGNARSDGKQSNFRVHEIRSWTACLSTHIHAGVHSLCFQDNCFRLIDFEEWPKLEQDCWYFLCQPSAVFHFEGLTASRPSSLKPYSWPRNRGANSHISWIIDHQLGQHLLQQELGTS